MNLFSMSRPGSRQPLRAGKSLLVGLCSAVLLSALLPSVARADDTEIFRAEYEDANARPKVLIVFDNSGSMDSIVANSRVRYDPNTTYPTMTGIVAGRLYWSSSSNGNPPSADTDQWFDASINRCASSVTPLSTTGIYNGSQFARWVNNSGWLNGLPNSNSTRTASLHVECRADISGNNNSNPGHTDGYPRNSTSTPPYATNKAGNSFNRDFGGDTSRRLYTANYMNFYHNAAIPKVDRSRLEIAQEVVSGVIDSSPGIDFGLAVFNTNTSSSNNGGRIARRIIENMSSTQRSSLITLVNGLTAETNTPLCETMYEVYRYLTGDTPQWGNVTSPTNPVKDAAAQSGGKYISPVGDCQYVYVIYMTDGEPTSDTSANSLVETLTGKTCRSWGGTKNCLPELTEYMANIDLDGNPNNGVQKAVTYTIGFATDQALLQDTAAKGGGRYFTANNVDELTSAFQGAITGILSTNSTFTSPAVAVDSYSRTESRDEVFFAMFLPQEGTNWPGNIKKLRAQTETNGSLTLVDSTGTAAISNGAIASTARTYWSTEADGSDVRKGGVGGVLQAGDLSARKLLINTGTSPVLEAFTYNNFTHTKFGQPNRGDLLTWLGASSDDDLRDLLAWTRGYIRDGVTTKRDWILGDILHSRPIILNYGVRTANTDPDLRIVAGTNAGFLHMFKNSDGSESWAFMPKEIANIMNRRRTNTIGGVTIYGVDAPVVVYQHDQNNDGNIRPADGDKMYIFFGLRGGGRAYYAMDVTDPDDPKFLWKIDNNTTGFAELGQSWSVPTVAVIPGYADGSVPKPVLIFGGGYDPVYDSQNNVAYAASASASQGRGIYIVDAATGALVWSATPAATSATNKQASGFRHAFAAPVSVFDSNGDRLADRIYATDVGGNIWRIDMGSSRPTTTAEQSRWQISKLAELGSDAIGATATHADDRRFFSAVDMVATTSGGRNYYMLSVGSGDRNNPNATDNTDRFFMVRDLQFMPLVSAPPTAAECNPTTGSRREDVRCSWPIRVDNLYNATPNTIQVGTAAENQAALAALNAAQGWYLNLTAATGEKSLAASITLQGRVYFTTFSPDTAGQVGVNVCTPRAGTARQYAVALADARAVIDYNGSGSNVFTTADRNKVVGSGIFDTPSTFFKSRGAGGGVDLIRQNYGIESTNVNTNRRVRTYWFDREL